LDVATRKMRPPVKKHGGKAYLARRIIALFPGHRVYCEPFLGAGSVLLNKPKSPVELAGDLDAGLIGFWRNLRSRPETIISILDGTPYSRTSFELAREQIESPLEHFAAVGYLVRNRMSRGGLGRDFAWSERLRGKTRPGGPIPGDVNAWDTIREELPAIAGRIRDVEFRCVGAASLIREVDAEDVVIYCDPPYYPDSRTHKEAYAHEMTRSQHAELLGVLLGCKGKVFLSGYRNELYDVALRDWTLHAWDMPNHSGQGKTKQRRTECVWEKP
jgi:DNA adenine methylase